MVRAEDCSDVPVLPREIRCLRTGMSRSLDAALQCSEGGGVAFIGGDLEWKTAVFTELISQIDDALVMRVVVPADANGASLLMCDFEQFKDVHHGFY